MNKQAVIKYKKDCGVEYKESYIVDDKEYFEREFDVVYSFDTEDMLSRVALNPNSQEYPVFSDVFYTLYKKYGNPWVVEDELDNSWPTQRIYWKDRNTRVALIYEGCCTSISEAMVLGRPVIASNCFGNVEQIHRYGAGLLVGLSAEEIADGIIQAIQHPERLGVERIDQDESSGQGSLERFYSVLE